MKHLNIYCDEFDFSTLASGFDGHFKSTVDLSCEIVFTDEDGIRTLNREQRHIDAVTDVLSFPTLEGHCGKRLCKKDHFSEIDEDGNLFIGSIVICTKRAQEQAEEYGHSYNRELHYLACHGVCHLLGYDHMEEQDKIAMRAVEESVLGAIGITRED